MVRIRTRLGWLFSLVFFGLSLAQPAGASPPMTPAGWRLTPAGEETTVVVGPGLAGPWADVVSPDGKSVLVTSSGTAARFESVEQFDVGSLTRTGLVAYDGSAGQSVFYGIAYSPDGKHAWASGGGQGVVHAYDVTSGGLVETGQIASGFFLAGLAYARTPLGPRLYVADSLGDPPFTTGSYEDPPGHSVTVIDPETNTVTAASDLGEALDPLGVAFNREGTKAYVTQWVGRSVAVIDTHLQTKIGVIELSPRSNPFQADHPSGITANPRRAEVYTANANSDTVSVIDTKRDRLAATIDVGLVPEGPKGSMPEGLAVSPDGRMLYVALAGEDAVAVVDLDRRRTIGFIPTAWYPSGVAATPDGRSLVVVNTNGFGAGPNRCGGVLNPLPPDSCMGDQYAGSMIRGSVERIRVPSHGQLQAWTRQVRENNRAREREARKPGWLKSIKHVIYVIKENRTYDQVFGDLGKGNGDPAIDLFKDDSARTTATSLDGSRCSTTTTSTPRCRPTGTPGRCRGSQRTTSTRRGRSTTHRPSTGATTRSSSRSPSSSRASRWPRTRPCRVRRRPPRPGTSGTTPSTAVSASATTARARLGTTRATAVAGRSSRISRG